RTPTRDDLLPSHPQSTLGFTCQYLEEPRDAASSSYQGTFEEVGSGFYKVRFFSDSRGNGVDQYQDIPILEPDPDEDALASAKTRIVRNEPDGRRKDYWTPRDTLFRFLPSTGELIGVSKVTETVYSNWLGFPHQEVTTRMGPIYHCRANK